jgi:hypothetical protein
MSPWPPRTFWILLIGAYKIMKDIMAGESSTEDQGVPSFTLFPPRCAKASSHSREERCSQQDCSGLLRPATSQPRLMNATPQLVPFLLPCINAPIHSLDLVGGTHGFGASDSSRICNPALTLRHPDRKRFHALRICAEDRRYPSFRIRPTLCRWPDPWHLDGRYRYGK